MDDADGLLLEGLRATRVAWRSSTASIFASLGASCSLVLGPSGAGKSTLLRVIAGLERATDGRVVIAGDDVTAMRPGRRNVSMVFQSSALFPHLSVGQNIALGTDRSGPPRAVALERAPPGRSGGRLRRPPGSSARSSSQVASGSGSRWPGRSYASRMCSCSTSHCPIWTLSCGSR